MEEDNYLPTNTCKAMPEVQRLKDYEDQQLVDNDRKPLPGKSGRPLPGSQ
jgi:hypothetical protein